MENWTMEYNSQRELLIIPEYGRNVQKLISHAKNIEDKEMKLAFLEKVINLMMQMHPQNRNLDDHREKLWKHVFRIANYELDIVPPSGVIPVPGEYKKIPEQVDYPGYEARFRHYGSNVQRLVKKALSMEEGPVRDGFVGVIGSYMKLAYKTWNKEHYVSDEVIKQDLSSLSNGQLILKEDASLDNLANANRRKKRSQGNGHKDHQGGRDHRDRDGRDRDRDYKRNRGRRRK